MELLCASVDNVVAPPSPLPEPTGDGAPLFCAIGHENPAQESFTLILAIPKNLTKMMVTISGGG